MKKLVFLVAAALAFTGLVGVGGATADPYPGTVTPVVKPKVKKVYKAKKAIKVKYKAASGNLKAKGTLKIVIKAANGKKIVKTVKYKGKNQKIKLGKLKPGKYKVTFKLKPKNPVFKNTKTKAKFKVKR